jgi:hypothetical protein
MIELERLLEKMKQDRGLFSRFLHTLSFLEYLGARKIIKSQHQGEITLEILSHAVEEMRHARVFKKLACEIGSLHFKGYVPHDLMCMSEAKNYFSDVDSEVSKVTSDPRVNYAVTTFLVEQRALQVYPAVERVLSSLGFPNRVSGILREEESHLSDMQSVLSGIEPILARCQEFEKKAFDILLNAMKRDVLAHKSMPRIKDV